MTIGPHNGRSQTIASGFQSRLIAETSATWPGIGSMRQRSKQRRTSPIDGRPIPALSSSSRTAPAIARSSTRSNGNTSKRCSSMSRRTRDPV
jgi:hypothetical protein